MKGIPGYLGGTELDNVGLAGAVDIDNLVGLPGIRPPATPQMAALAAPIQVSAYVIGNARIMAVTGSNINIALRPDPDLGVLALGQSNDGRRSASWSMEPWLVT